MTRAKTERVQGNARAEGDTRLDDDAVAAFLANNSDFFNRRPELLPELAMPAKSGTVVSLAERQAAILRDRNQEMHQRLAALIAVAKDNDRTFAGMRDLVLALMDADTWARLDATLAEQFLGGFGADHVLCRIAADCAERTEQTNLAHVVYATGDDALGKRLDQPHPTCDAFRPNDYAAIFPGAELSDPGSIAIVPMRPTHKDSLRGILAIGAEDPNRFTPDMGIMFLSFAGDALARTLTRLRQNADS